VGAILVDMISGVQSAFRYAGAPDLRAFHEGSVFGVQTPGGYGEGMPRPGDGPR
jgi:IMP dehydrogenase